MAEVGLGLGANLGDRGGAIISALQALDAMSSVRLTALSGLYRTAPWGLTDQPDFLNMAALIETELQPLEVLKTVKALELASGRRVRERWGPREIDIDLLFYDNLELVSDGLVLPHPGLFQRRFVLAPLVEICPDRPILGRTPVRGLSDLPGETSGEVVPDPLETHRLALAFPGRVGRI
ncbi:MAG: 2-amino-4-hydroxy-6-hydroxymethyldihydropteridine diphosphokinase [Alphaproteobacteria bacterium]|nr:2-amino-4-hydroxy-6-hydroxymethyldihydropteridine diphosphokinase [Alphaproteobacteria bacterium]